MKRIVVDEEAAESKSRIAFVSLLRLNLRLMDNWRRVQIDIWGRAFDYESTLILIAIVVVGAERLLEHGVDPGLQTLANPMPLERLRRCNISSIAAATSLNRETVRRRIKSLEEAGLVTRDRGGVRIAFGVLQRPEMREVVRSQLFATARTVSELMQESILTTDNKRGGRD